MAGDVVIRAENLGKKYMIGHEAERERYVALRDVMAGTARDLASTAARLLAGRRRDGGKATEEFWALKDVAFEVRRGEVLGVIGRNGAGKSTLLKILSRITEPSEGRVTVKGRVASLLEVGTGFHPELTGRENIYLNGAVLGMSRAEVRRQFDAIVDFAEVERFLDTPVKRYSSGMYVRLAFAVAAHLQPDILIVDEVLAVGDLEFQKKCLGKMQEVSGQSGRTVLFVSHNMGAIADTCPRAILLEHGRVATDAPTPQVIGRYVGAHRNRGKPIDRAKLGRETVLLGAEIVGEQASNHSTLWSKEFGIQFQYRAAAIAGLEIAFSLFDKHGRRILYSALEHPDRNGGASGPFVATAKFPGRFLAPGSYSVSASLHEPLIRFHDNIDGLLSFTIIGDKRELYRYGSNDDFGVLTIELDWTVEKLVPALPHTAAK